MLMVAIYARAITLFWWGPEAATHPALSYNRFMLGAAVVLLVFALRITGFWPHFSGCGA
jgi:hypothetical protein